MANVAASAKLGQGFGQVFPNNNVKCVCISFATTASGDVLVFDASNVGKENAISKITFAMVIAGSGALSSLSIASNQMSVGIGNNAAATNCVALVCGVAA